MARTGKQLNTYKVMLKRFKRKKPRVRPRCRWESTEVDLKETGLDGVDWIHMVQDTEKWRAFVNTVTNVTAALNAGNLTSCGTISFSRMTLVHEVKSIRRQLVGKRSKFGIRPTVNTVRDLENQKTGSVKGKCRCHPPFASAHTAHLPLLTFHHIVRTCVR
jgi:hypothetical protein